jgi:ATP-dependent exoDNAse (exonuclease V) beta subunit
MELDNFNLLYVSLTRAVEQLHVITEKKLSSKGEENINFYSGVFINYLKQLNLWNDDELEYSFGDKKRASKRKELKSVAEIHDKFISTPWQEHNVVLLAGASKLWDTTQGEAINFGNLIHEILSKIITIKNIDTVVAQFQQQGFMNLEQSKEIKDKIYAIVGHQKLKKYFSEDVTIYNEREIVDVDNQILIPDRLVFNDNNQVTIIDYKTGSPSNEHHQQLLKYERVLKSMDFKVIKKLLIYINQEIDVVEV